MTRSCINICLLAVISLLFGVIWQCSAIAAMPTIQPLGSLTEGLNVPGRIAVDGAGNLYVANVSGKNIVKFDKYGTRVATLGSVQVTGLGLAVSSDGNAIYASAGDKVAVLDGSGVLQGYLGSGVGEFNIAGDIALGANGEAIVADNFTHLVKAYPVAGGSVVLSGNTFGGISSIAVDPVSGDIYIADPIFGAVQTPHLYVYYSDYTYKTKLSAASAFGSRLQFFGGQAFDSAGRLYVGDYESGNIRVVQLPALLLGTYDDGVLAGPSSVAYDVLTNRLYVTWLGIRVDIYGVDGGTTPVRANTAPTVPVPVTVGEVASRTPVLVFNNSTDAEGNAISYELRVLSGATQVASFTVAQNVPALVNVSLVENASYTWQVRASDGLLSSAWSAPQAIYVNATQEAPSAPVLTSHLAGEIAGGDASLTWSVSSDADPFASISYRVEVLNAASAVVASTTTVGSSTAVVGFSGDLTAGATYGWRVVAIDNTARETVSSNVGSFVFQTSVLKVTANVSGARVFLGGHHGYAGRLLGTAPVQVHDLAAGSYSVVVEAAGFEPFVATVSIVKDAQTDVAAELKGARLATSFGQHALNLAGLTAQGAAPIVADLDQDNVLDLLLAENGYLYFYQGSLTQGPQAADTIEYLVPGTATLTRLVFAAGKVQLANLPQISGASPCLVDWNNDDKLDLIIGGSDGSLKLFLGQGGLSFPAVGQDLINVSSQQVVPAVGDVDGDGDKDLVVATGNDLYLVVNEGSDSAPLLGAQTLMSSLGAPVVPLFNDWNADGRRELLLLSAGKLYQTEVAGTAVTATSATGLTVAGAERVFALNFAGSNYTDLVFSTSTGGLMVANGQQGGYAPAYKEALLTKLADVEQKVNAQAPELLGQVANIASRIGRGKYDSAKTKAEQLAAALAAGSPAEIAAVELAGILQ